MIVVLNESSGRKIKASVLALASISFLSVLLIDPLTGYTHEPITTNVRFNREIIRIFERSCLACHSAGRIKADIPLNTYDVARPWAKAIKEEVLEKRMPPYQVVKGFGSFHRDYGLSQRDVDLIVSWVEGGAPKGDDKDLPGRAETSSGWALGAPDLILQPASETKIPRDGDTTLCLLLPTDLKKDRWMSGLEFRPGNSAVVHSASVSLLRGASSRPNAGPRRDAGCNTGGSGSTSDELGTWVPGQVSIRFPDGVARLLPAGSRVELKIHYHSNGEVTRDRSAIGFYFAGEEPVRQVKALTLAAPLTSVPVGVQSFRVKSSYVLPGAAEAIGLRPILFPFAKSVEATAYRPDGTAEVLVWAKNRRLDWEPIYYFRRPVELPKGTRIEVVAYLDNSAENPNNPHDPPRAVQFAEPLCDLFLTQSVDLR